MSPVSNKMSGKNIGSGKKKHHQPMQGNSEKQKGLKRELFT